MISRKWSASGTGWAVAGTGMLQLIWQGQDFSPGHYNSCTLQKVTQAGCGRLKHSHKRSACSGNLYTAPPRGAQTSWCSLESALVYLSLWWVLRGIYCVNKEQPMGCIRDSLTPTHHSAKQNYSSTGGFLFLSPATTHKPVSTRPQALRPPISQSIYVYMHL